MKNKTLIMSAVMAIGMAVTSCSAPKDYSYFQDLRPGTQNTLPSISPVKLQPTDKISIIVSTQDGRLNSLFNLSMPSNNSFGGVSSSSSTVSGSNGVAPYTIDSRGDINFPVLGKLHVAGMTREELAEYIRRELISRDLAKEPIVTVEYLNLAVTVLGEVGGPGRQFIDRENYTILDAIASAGDLTPYGHRNNIKVLREDNGVQRVYEVDITKGKELTLSPVYYLKQNDVIYVEPNATKARNSTPNGNSAFTPGFWFSMVTFAISMGTLVISLTK